MHSDREARIRERAHKIWQDEGQIEGKAAEHWHRAEQEIGDDEQPAVSDGSKRPTQKPSSNAVATNSTETKPKRASADRGKTAEPQSARRKASSPGASGTR